MGAQPQNHPNLLVGQLKIDGADPTQAGVYSVGTVKKHIFGTRYRIGDRVFRYGKALNALLGGRGAFNTAVHRYIDGGVVSARAIGDMWVDILLDATEYGATWFGTKNNMVGGFIVMDGIVPPSFRIITGHEKGASAAIIKVYLDGPLVVASDAATAIGVAQNPYSLLGNTSDQYMGVMGVSNVAIPASSFAWFQTWGPCRITPALPCADTILWRTVVFMGDGSIRSWDDAIADVNEIGYQVAGFVIDATTGGIDNPPFIMLQISP